MPDRNDSDKKGYGALKSTPITGTDTFNPPTRFIHVSTTGNIVGMLEEDSVDRTFGGLIAGGRYNYHFKSISSATATVLALF